MYGLKVRVRAVIDDTSDPVRVECVMTDFDGQTHIFRDKLPIFCAEFAPVVPCDGIIRCTLTDETPLYAEISTALPDAVESIMGVDRFRVSKDDLIDNV